MKKRNRLDRIGGTVAPAPRFWAAIAALPGFLLIDNLLWRGLLVVLFAVLALAAGKHIQWLYFVTLIISVTFFHLLAPMGRVLVEIGPFVITEGGLRNGLSRGMGMVGMVFLSVAAVRPEVEIPGRFGGLIGRTFYYFDLIIEGKSRITRKEFLGSLDRMLMEQFAADSEHGSRRSTGRPSSLKGLGWAMLIALMPWAVWGFTRFGFLG